MAIQDSFARVPLDQIKINRDDRQRSQIDPKDIIDSIKIHGVLNPVIITTDYLLVAGERRLEASRQLGLPDIPVRFLEELTSTEAKIIELEENVKRSELPWRDEVRAVGELHSIYMTNDPGWNQGRTAASLAMTEPAVSRTLRVFRDLDSPKIAGATSTNMAFNTLARLDQRVIGDAMEELMGKSTQAVEQALAGKTTGAAVPVGGGVPPVGSSPIALSPMPTHNAAPVPTPPSSTILHARFQDWVQSYTGPKFNFIHCDFPYGINVFAGKQMSQGNTEVYNDSGDIYFDLIETLCTNLDKIASQSCHLMFWFGIQHYQKTLDIFRRLAPGLVFNSIPMIWLKSDNVGVLSDPNRGPRHIYETAFLASRGDRFIVKAKSNAYPAPTEKSTQPTVKPEPVLRHFFSMFVDENTIMLDPTCGSGSAIRAAESLGAKSSLGLEMDKENFENAQGLLKQFQNLRRTK